MIKNKHKEYHFDNLDFDTIISLILEDDEQSIDYVLNDFINGQKIISSIIDKIIYNDHHSYDHSYDRNKVVAKITERYLFIKYNEKSNEKYVCCLLDRIIKQMLHTSFDDNKEEYEEISDIEQNLTFRYFDDDNIDNYPLKLRLRFYKEIKDRGVHDRYINRMIEIFEAVHNSEYEKITEQEFIMIMGISTEKNHFDEFLEEYYEIYLRFILNQRHKETYYDIDKAFFEMINADFVLEGQVNSFLAINDYRYKKMKTIMSIIMNDMSFCKDIDTSQIFKMLSFLYKIDSTIINVAEHVKIDIVMTCLFIIAYRLDEKEVSEFFKECEYLSVYCLDINENSSQEFMSCLKEIKNSKYINNLKIPFLRILSLYEGKDIIKAYDNNKISKEIMKTLSSLITEKDLNTIDMSKDNLPKLDMNHDIKNDHLNKDIKKIQEKANDEIMMTIVIKIIDEYSWN